MSDVIVASAIAASAAVGSGIVTALIAYGGIRLTAKTSMAANARLVEVSERNNTSVVRSSCESKIAEMRVHWNDDLRISLAKFGSAVASLVSAISMGAKPDSDEKQYWYVYSVLKLNRNDAQHEKLIAVMNEMMGFANQMLEDKSSEQLSDGKALRGKFEDIFTEYSKRSTEILKQEWDRAKRETREAWATTT